MALTPDAIPTNEQLVESLADRFYHPHKRAIWLGGVLFFAAIVGYLAIRQYRSTRLDDMWGRYHDAAQIFSWPDPRNPIAAPDTAAAKRQLESLQMLVRDYPDDTVTPYAFTAIAKDQYVLGEYDNAAKTLGELRSKFKDFPLNTLPADADAAGRARPFVDKFEDTVKRETTWATKHAYVHHWPAEDRIALVETSVGSFWLGFYFEEAAKHCESFIQHAKRGDYNGTQVYEIIQSTEGAPERFACGSKSSGLADKGGVRDPADHDRDEPTDTIEPEDSRTTIRNLYRVVSAAKMESGESATRFVIVAKRDGVQKMNGEYTPFAAVLDREESLKSIDRIGRGSTYGTNTKTKDKDGTYRMRDHPNPAIYIRRVTIWSKEKIEEGHAWDTKRAEENKNEPEPWEKDLTTPEPEEFVPKPVPAETQSPTVPKPPK